MDSHQLAERLLEHLQDPEALEALYCAHPEAFARAVEEALKQRPDSETLRVWRARLSYRCPPQDTWERRLLYRTVGIGLAAGALVRFPALVFGEEWYYPRFGPLWVLLSLAAYFLAQHPDRRRLLQGALLTVVSGVWVSLLPGSGDYYPDAVVMALLHLPVLFLLYVGMVYVGDDWSRPEARCRFVRYGGELLVLGSLLGLGGMVLSFFTVGLFSLLIENPEEWYFSNVGIFGAAAIPVVATFLYEAVFQRRTVLLSILARIFAPLFLLMVTAFLLASAFTGKNPFLDRDFLIVFNGVLLFVLGIVVFSLVARESSAPVGVDDYVRIALTGVTLLVNAVALSAIVFRLVSFGLTPNRVVVLGANMVMGVHLLWIGYTYLRFVRGNAGYPELERVVGAYLPVYGLWAAVVVFILPLLFDIV